MSHSRWENCGPDLPIAFYRGSSCIMGGWVWLTGGMTPEHGAQNSTYRWKPGMDQWQKMADMKMARILHVMISVDTSLYAIGGYQQLGTYKHLYQILVLKCTILPKTCGTDMTI